MIDLASTHRETLTIPEVREIFGKSERTIYYWLRAGRLTVVDVPVGYGARISTESVRALARAVYGCVPRTSTPPCSTSVHSPQSSAKAS